uniref:Arrestin-like N-terminal domain-containing protein n=1 Tax=Meloidogyne incognita TaxID=6306 RepID=A0A914N8T0_MELIC
MVVARSPSAAAASMADSLFERFEVEFDAGTHPVFHGGELITGSLKIQLKKEVTINAIRIQFRGRAVYLDPKHPTKEAAEKVYFDKNFILLERPPGHPEPGHFPWSANFLYSLPFECPLPKGCETSYEGPHGFIRYYARAILETAEPDKAKYIVKQCFSIISSPELHQLVPPISDPISEKKTVRFGSCCCRGKMTAEILLPKSSYAPGEDVIGNFTMDSSTAKNALEHIEARLIDRLQRITSDLEPIKEATPTVTEPVNGVETKSGKKLKNKQKQKNGTNDNSANKAEDQQQKEETKKQKKSNSIPTTKPSPSSTNSFERHRVVFGRRLVKEDFKGETTPERRNSGENKNVITKTNVYFLRIPAIISTTQLNDQQQQQSASQFDELVDGVDAENGQFHRLLESPSTATLRARREPFLRVDYALQYYRTSFLDALIFLDHLFGNSCARRNTYSSPSNSHLCKRHFFIINNFFLNFIFKGIGFQPFAGGAQSVAESDESSYIPCKGPFIFAPLYPVYLEPPKNLIVSEETILTPISEPAIKTTTNVKSQHPKQSINGGIKSEELQQQPFIVVTSTSTTKEENTKKTITTFPETTTTTTTTITEERTTITKEEEENKIITEEIVSGKDNFPEVSELNKGGSEIKEKPLEQIIIKEEKPETIIIEEQEQLPNGGTKTTKIEETILQQNGDESDEIVRKSVVETEAYEINND